MPPLEDWRGEGRTVSNIARTLRLNTNQHRRVLHIIVRTHHALLTSAEYDSMREFRAGSAAIKPGSLEEQAVADYRERCLSYTETMILINQQCVQDGRPTVTCSVVYTCEVNRVQEVNLIEKRPQGNKDAGSN